jgi:outer membrane protein assembly factor BamD (BamD/ComL family)
MGGIYKNEKHFDKAIAAFNELIERYPDDYWARQAQWKKDDTVWENEYGAVLD